jgi:hypothetical protein
MARKTIGENPLDSMISPKINGTSVKEQTAAPKQAARKPSTKERITVQISSEVIEGVKDVVYWNRLTVAQFTEDALREAIKKAEKENGGSFKKRSANLKPGRPLK